MTPAQTETARRLMALPEWRWREGMRDAGGTVMCIDGAAFVSNLNGARWAFLPVSLPDLSSPANVGSLLEMLREAAGGTVSAFFFSDGRCEMSVYPPRHRHEPTRRFVGEAPAHAIALAILDVLGGSDA